DRPATRPRTVVRRIPTASHAAQPPPDAAPTDRLEPAAEEAAEHPAERLSAPARISLTRHGASPENRPSAPAPCGVNSITAHPRALMTPDTILDEPRRQLIRSAQGTFNDARNLAMHATAAPSLSYRFQLIVC